MNVLAEKVKKASLILANTTNKERCDILEKLKCELIRRKKNIFDANREDCDTVLKEKCLDEALLKRLALTESKFEDCIKGIDNLISKPDPIGKCDLATALCPDLNLFRVTCPIGVLAVVFEARPEVAIQIAALALRSANGLILKGGKEATRTIHAIYESIQCSIYFALNNTLIDGCVQIIDTREDVLELLRLDKYIDLIIPRGSNSLVRYIKEHTKIPVLGHADGLCTVYVDIEADINMAVDIVKDSKTNYPAACNACETVLVHEKIVSEFLPLLRKTLNPFGMIYHADKTCMPYFSNAQEATLNDFSKEFLSLEIVVKSVKDIDEAIEHINCYGSHHTDVIVTNNTFSAHHFLNRVDSAGVFHNASSRFADGYRYGFGAEVGISTNRIHARGPVGLEGLLIYKNKLFGSGQTVNQISEGHEKFIHQPLLEYIGKYI